MFTHNDAESLFERWGTDPQVYRVTLSRAGGTAYYGNSDMHLQFLIPTKANIWYSHHYFFRILGKDCIRYLLFDLNVEDCYPWAPFSHGIGNIASFISLIKWWLYVRLRSEHLPPFHPPSFPSAWQLHFINVPHHAIHTFTQYEPQHW